MREPGAGSAPPDPSELPRFAPVVDSDDDADGGRDGGDFDIDRGLLRVIGVIVLLAIVIAVLVLPPVSLLDRGDGTSSSIVTRARESIPELPNGILALSALYDIEVPVSLAGAATLTVKLSEQIGDIENLAFYTYRDDRWTRLASATAVDGGRAAQGELDAVPSTIAVLRRVAFARSLGLIVDAGEAPDPSASGAGIVSVLAAGPALEGDETAGSLSYDPAALGAARAGGSAAVYLGLSAPAGAPAEAVDRMLGTPALSDAHVEDIVAAATRTEAAGVHVDYLSVDPARRTPFTSFVRNLAQALAAKSMGLVVGVPTPPSAASGSDGHAYDWAALAEVADVLWLRPPADPASYYEQLEAVLEAHRAEGVDLGVVWLVVDRYSRERSAGGSHADLAAGRDDAGEFAADQARRRHLAGRRGGDLRDQHRSGGGQHRHAVGRASTRRLLRLHRARRQAQRLDREPLLYGLPARPRTPLRSRRRRRGGSRRRQGPAQHLEHRGDLRRGGRRAP